MRVCLGACTCVRPDVLFQASSVGSIPVGHWGAMAKRIRPSKCERDFDRGAPQPSWPLLQDLLQAPDTSKYELLLRSVYHDRVLDKHEVFEKAELCLQTLQEVRTSVIEDQARDDPMNTELTDPQFEAALQKLKEKYLLEFACDKTLAAIYRLQARLDAGSGNSRQIKRDIHALKRNNFHAWLHDFAGNKHIGFALLRFETTRESLLQFAKAHHVNLVEQ